MTTNEPWSSDYRQLSIIPVISGSADTGYTGSFKVNRTLPDGGFERVAERACDGTHATRDQALETALETAKQCIDALLGPN